MENTSNQYSSNAVNDDEMGPPICYGCTERDFKIRSLLTEIDNLKTNLEGQKNLVQYLSNSLSISNELDPTFPIVEIDDDANENEAESMERMTIDQIPLAEEEKDTDTSEAKPLFCEDMESKSAIYASSEQSSDQPILKRILLFYLKFRSFVFHCDEIF